MNQISRPVTTVASVHMFLSPFPSVKVIRLLSTQKMSNWINIFQRAVPASNPPPFSVKLNLGLHRHIFLQLQSSVEKWSQFFSSAGEHSFSLFQVDKIPTSICVPLTSPLINKSSCCHNDGLTWLRLILSVKLQWFINHHIDCNSKNFVCMIQCNQCHN